ncbi:MAG: hypothetical protein RL757_2231 [Bacteroidota bacterium]
MRYLHFIYRSYFFRRLMFFVPTLLAICIITFGMSQCAAGDPVLLALEMEVGQANAPVSDIAYHQMARKLGTDKPVFYGSILPISFPDTLFKFLYRSHIKTVEKTIGRYGNWEKQATYFQTLTFLEQNSGHNESLKNIISQLWETNEVGKMNALLEQIKVEQHGSFAHAQANTMRLLANDFKNNATVYKNYIPKIIFYGADNQFHHWFVRILKGDFGKNKKEEPIGKLMEKPLVTTLYFGFLTLLFSYCTSIPLGIWLVKSSFLGLKRRVSDFLYLSYTFPTFSLATFLVLFFTNDTYGLKVASIGLAEDFESKSSIFSWLFNNFGSFILPILCFSVHIIPILTGQLEQTMRNAMRQEFIKTARGKGLTEKQILWRHALPNALAPILAALGTLFPLMVGGSMIIEVVFDIPGMGNLLFKAMMQRDYNLVFGIVLLISFMTLLGSFISDLLHAHFDPRVRFKFSI